MKEDNKLQGLCKECMHRNSCKDAKRHLNMIACGRYKHWKKLNQQSSKMTMTEQEAKQVLQKILEYVDDMPESLEIAVIAEALRIAIEKL